MLGDTTRSRGTLERSTEGTVWFHHLFTREPVKLPQPAASPVSLYFASPCSYSFVLHRACVRSVSGGCQWVMLRCFKGVWVKGPPWDIWGEAWSFCLAIFIYFTREIESFNFFHLRIGWKYLFQYLYFIYFSLPCGKNIYFHHILWSFIYFTHFYYKNIYFQKTPAPPPVF